MNWNRSRRHDEMEWAEEGRNIKDVDLNEGTDNGRKYFMWVSKLPILSIKGRDFIIESEMGVKDKIKDIFLEIHIINITTEISKLLETADINCFGNCTCCDRGAAN